MQNRLLLTADTTQDNLQGYNYMSFIPTITADTIILAVSALAALAMIYFAYRNIKEQVLNANGTKEDVFKARRVEQLKIAVEIEKHISETYLMFTEFSVQIANKNERNENDDFYLNALTERYLYAIDMLCYSINKGYLDNESDWKNKYNDMVCTNIRTYEQYYGMSTPYKNTIEIYKKWNGA